MSLCSFQTFHWTKTLGKTKLTNSSQRECKWKVFSNHSLACPLQERNAFLCHSASFAIQRVSQTTSRVLLPEKQKTKEKTKTSSPFSPWISWYRKWDWMRTGNNQSNEIYSVFIGNIFTEIYCHFIYFKNGSTGLT